MIQVQLDPAIEARLLTLANQAGKPAHVFISQAIIDYLEEAEDIIKAKSRLAHDEAEWSQEDIERELGI